MRFSDLKKKMIKIDDNSTKEISISQKDIFKKELISGNDEDKTSPPKEISHKESKAIDDGSNKGGVGLDPLQVKDKDFSTKREFEIKNNERSRIIRFDDIEYEKTLIFYSNLLKKFEGVVEKISDSSYLSAADDIRYLSFSIFDEVENQYLPLMLSYLTAGNYLISHSINLAILSGLISKNLHFEKDSVLKIITAALCIDLGMPFYRHLYLQERMLSKEEKEVIKMHVKDGVEIVEKIFSFDEGLREFVSLCVENSHERYDGSGYYLKKGDEIDLYSQIVAISDFYEALTHPRPWRGSFEEPCAMEMITSKYRRLFTPNAIKGAVLSLGMYPPGSLVRLSTGEIAEVLFVNRERIFKPYVRVFMDAHFQEISPMYLDLADYPLTSIDSYVRGEEFAKANPDLKSRFDLKRLWVRW